MSISTFDKTELLSHVRRACRDGDLRRLRERAGLSQHDAAEACQVSVSTFLRWERGYIVPQREGRPERLWEFLSRLIELTDEDG